MPHDPIRECLERAARCADEAVNDIKKTLYLPSSGLLTEAHVSRVLGRLVDGHANAVAEVRAAMAQALRAREMAEAGKEGD